MADYIFWTFISIFPGIALLTLFLRSKSGDFPLARLDEISILKSSLLGLNLIFTLSLSFYALNIFSRNVSVGFVSILIFFSTLGFIRLFSKDKNLFKRYLISLVLISCLLMSMREFLFRPISEFSYGHGRFLSSDKSAYLWPMGGPLFWLISPLNEFELNSWISTSAISTVLLFLLIILGSLKTFYKLIIIATFLLILAAFDALAPAGSISFTRTGGYSALVFFLIALYANWEFSHKRHTVLSEDKRNELEASRIEFYLLLSCVLLTTGVYGSLLAVFVIIHSILTFRKKLLNEFRFFSMYPIPIAFLTLNLILLLTEYYRRFLMG